MFSFALFVFLFIVLLGTMDIAVYIAYILLSSPFRRG